MKYKTSLLIEQLRKIGLSISNTSKSNSTILLLQMYLHILRFESVNDNTLHSLYLNHWILSLDRIYPDIYFKSLSNISQVFSPSFTRALFVRHPLERLASAYQNKIVTRAKDRLDSESHYDLMRKTICPQFKLRRYPFEHFM